ncbi:MAG: transcription elongation factor GreA [Oscillospiraceae bacterium]|nr:transcription elongation factor GreA [Oscillospiraceae bacterium]MBR6696081.1 transcription elongation factor GreA [Oscillospiraceae bacterium]
MAKAVKITREGLEELKQKLDFLKTVKSTEIEQKLKEARGHGDLSENSEYDEAKNEQGKLAAEIAELEASIANAVIVESTNTSSSEVGIGSKIRLLDIELGEEEIIKIVGYAEANFEEGKISDESPIGMAVMGKKAGDVVEVQTPEGVVEMKIVEIIKK